MVSREWLIDEVLPRFEKEYRIFEYLMLADLLGEDGCLWSLQAELDGKQNADGGFPGYFEPDIRSASSAVIATVEVLEMYYQAGGIASGKVRENVREYLDRTYDPEYQGWHIISGDISDAPRASWWNSELEETFGYPNPTALIVAFNKVLDLGLKADTDLILDNMISREVNVVNMHDYKCLVTMFRLLEMEVPQQLYESALKLVEWDEDKWKDYCLGPSEVIDSKAHPYYDKYRKAVDRHLEYRLEQFRKSGYIDTSWTWGQFEDHFREAQMEWRGILTLNFIRTLDGFGLIS